MTGHYRSLTDDSEFELFYEVRGQGSRKTSTLKLRYTRSATKQHVEPFEVKEENIRRLLNWNTIEKVN